MLDNLNHDLLVKDESQEQISPHFGYGLMHDGVIALAQIEANGIRIDRNYLKRMIPEVRKNLDVLRSDLRKSDVGKMWEKKYGTRVNFGSRQQLSAILFSPRKFGGLGLTRPVEETESGETSMDKNTLDHFKLPFIKQYIRMQETEKALNTYLIGIQRELDENGFLHPSFHLHTARTYRSSSSEPNFQNFPVRNADIAALIRRCFIAREGYVLIENDFKGVEVTVATCYHRDPRMLSYLKDETKDMHRDMAMQIYFLKAKDVAKQIRHAAKNKFVFPVFYGDFYVSCAKHLWEEIEMQGLKGPDGKSLYEHLKRNGIHELGETEPDEEGRYPDPIPGTFVHHLKEVENDFWNNRFKVYGKWKKDWYNEYLENGKFGMFTGFHVDGYVKRNQVINFAVQGSAFHCLLWSLIRIQRILRKRKMKTKIVGQIHDSIVADVHLSEVDDYLAIVKQVTTVDILKVYKWIVLPLVIECEICPIGSTWYDKREVVVKRNGQYGSKDGKFLGKASDLIKLWEEEKKQTAAKN